VSFVILLPQPLQAFKTLTRVKLVNDLTNFILFNDKLFQNHKNELLRLFLTATKLFFRTFTPYIPRKDFRGQFPLSRQITQSPITDAIKSINRNFAS
jgi:hypothetical protein